jgi:hypothetical protein
MEGLIRHDVEYNTEEAFEWLKQKLLRRLRSVKVSLNYLFGSLDIKERKIVFKSN